MIKRQFNFFLGLAFILIVNTSWDYKKYIPISISSKEYNEKYVVTHLSNFPGINIGFKPYGLYDNFEEIEEKLFKHLKGVPFKQRYAYIVLHRSIKDEYGNDKKVDLYLANIDLQELKKYKEYKYWRNNFDNFLYKSNSRRSLEEILYVIRDKERSKFFEFFKGYVQMDF